MRTERKKKLHGKKKKRGEREGEQRRHGGEGENKILKETDTHGLRGIAISGTVKNKKTDR